jgi:transcriptional regulator with XRE-family HTH domain
MSVMALERVMAGMTGKEAAMKIGVTEHTISKWRTGKVQPDQAALHELARRTKNAPAELDALHYMTAGMFEPYNPGDYMDHPIVHMEVAAKEDADEDKHREGMALILGKRREKATETEVERVRRYNIELAQEIQAKFQQLAAICAWLGDSLTDTMRKARQ